MTLYYCRTIRENKGNVKEVQKAVKAILYHSLSTDNTPCHEYCPVGEKSWCGWQKDKALRIQNYKHKDPLPQTVADVYSHFLSV